jgi:hypothetical protein
LNLSPTKHGFFWGVLFLRGTGFFNICHFWPSKSSDPTDPRMQSSLEEHGLFTPSAHVLLSYSGGVDSASVGRPQDLASGDVKIANWKMAHL